jgi:hypothetical protein
VRARGRVTDASGRIADYRAGQMIALARSLLADNAERVASCRTTDAKR